MPLRIVVMGPSGSGKSAVGAELAASFGLPFVDGDDLHPARNVAKMAAGVPLDDDDRMPWLDDIGAALRDATQGDAGGLVVACSALGRHHRDRIRATAPEAVFVELRVPRSELERRMRERSHFMPPALLDSQLEALEPLAADEAGVAVDNDAPLDVVVARARDALAAVGQSLR
jgi:gluconokinase